MLMDHREPLTAQEISFLRSLPSEEYQEFLAAVRRQDPDEADAIQLAVEAHTFTTQDKPVVADFFGVSIDTIEAWQHKGMPYVAAGKGNKNTYDLRACARWIAARKAGQGNELAASVDVRYREEKLRVAELHRRKLEGELVDRSAWKEELTRLVSAIRLGMERMHKRYGNQFVGDIAEICDTIERTELGAKEDSENQ